VRLAGTVPVSVSAVAAEMVMDMSLPSVAVGMPKKLAPWMTTGTGAEFSSWLGVMLRTDGGGMDVGVGVSVGVGGGLGMSVGGVVGVGVGGVVGVGVGGVLVAVGVGGVVGVGVGGAVGLGVTVLVGRGVLVAVGCNVGDG